MPIAEAFETLEAWESEGESAERAATPIRRPSSASSFRPRPAPGTPQYVTQTQLEASLSRVDGKIKTASDGIATITTRVTALANSYKKEAEERKKSVEGQSKDLNQKLQLLALLPVLVQPPSVAGPQVGNTKLADGAGNPIPAVSVPDTNNLNLLLPLLLVSGMGGAGGPSLGGEGGGDSSMLLLALVLASAKK